MKRVYAVVLKSGDDRCYNDVRTLRGLASSVEQACAFALKAAKKKGGPPQPYIESVEYVSVLDF